MKIHLKSRKMAKEPTCKELSQEIHELEEKINLYRALVENNQDVFYRTDLEDKIVYVSSSVFEIFGYTIKEAIGKRLTEGLYLHPEERQVFLKKLQDGKVTDFQTQLLKKDGSIIYASTNAHYYRDKDGNIAGIEGMTRDISKLKCAEESLKVAEERFRLAFHTSPDSINLNRMNDGMYIDINQGFTDITGYSREDILGKTSEEIAIWKNISDRNKLVEDLKTQGFVKNLEAEFVKKSGKVGIGLMSASLLTINNETMILSVTKDITERKKTEATNRMLEKQLVQSQKLEAIGRLAGGISHDLNNMLSPIVGYSELLLLDTPENDPAKEKLEQIIKASQGAKDLVRQLLAFSRKQDLEFKPLNIDMIIKDFEKLLRRIIPENIQIEIIQSGHIPCIKADIGQIEQVIMNLSINAADAMPKGGRLIISIEQAEIAKVEPQSQIKPGHYVKLTFTDTGHGMNEETISQIFEPFFTTKGEQGTGLGLSTVYGIIKQHEGDIQVQSEIGKGTTFVIYIPAFHEQKPFEKKKNKQSNAISGTETILLVEDDSQVRDITRSLLERHGYTIFEATSASEALNLTSLPSSNIDLVLTDVVMPDMNGKELSDILAHESPDIKVIFMSGYTNNIIEFHGVPAEGVNFIQKPFTTRSLLTTVRLVLDK